MIYVIATIEVAEGRRADFLAEFHKLVPLVQQEQGCLEYNPTTDVDTNFEIQGGSRENVVTIMEKWNSLEDLEAHLVVPHMIQYRSQVKDLVKGMSLAVLQPA